MASKRASNGNLDGSGGDETSEIPSKRGKIDIIVTPKDGKAGDWICPNDNCQHHNYNFRQVCQKCFSSKDGEQIEKCEGKKPGDWNCPIDGHLNYVWRTHCQKCGNPNNKPWHGMGGPPIRFKNPNDWFCPNCGDHVYASRTNCRKCGCPKQHQMGPGMQGMGPMGFPGMGSHFGMRGGMGPFNHPKGMNFQMGRYGDGGSRPQGLKSGDWTCPTCFDLVYESRSHCRKCCTPKPEGFDMGFNINRSASIGGRPGDWTCPKCNDHVYASRSNCRKCDTPKPEDATIPDNLPELFGGDWRCPKCYDHVYASRDSCRKCNTPKPIHA